MLTRRVGLIILRANDPSSSEGDRGGNYTRDYKRYISLVFNTTKHYTPLSRILCFFLSLFMSYLIYVLAYFL